MPPGSVPEEPSAEVYVYVWGSFEGGCGKSCGWAQAGPHSFDERSGILGTNGR